MSRTYMRQIDNALALCLAGHIFDPFPFQALNQCVVLSKDHLRINTCFRLAFCGLTFFQNYLGGKKSIPLLFIPVHTSIAKTQENVCCVCFIFTVRGGTKTDLNGKNYFLT